MICSFPWIGLWMDSLDAVLIYGRISGRQSLDLGSVFVSGEDGMSVLAGSWKYEIVFPDTGYSQTYGHHDGLPLILQVPPGQSHALSWLTQEMLFPYKTCSRH